MRIMFPSKRFWIDFVGSSGGTRALVSLTPAHYVNVCKHRTGRERVRRSFVCGARHLSHLKEVPAMGNMYR